MNNNIKKIIATMVLTSALSAVSAFAVPPMSSDPMIIRKMDANGNLSEETVSYDDIIINRVTTLPEKPSETKTNSNANNTVKSNSQTFSLPSFFSRFFSNFR